MSEDAAQSEQASAVIEASTIAGFWRRLAAFFIDCIILGVPTLLLGLAAYDWAVNLGQAGKLVGFTVALLYFGLLNSRLNHGQTLGKKIFGIRVVDRNGEMLSPARSILRFLVLWVPFFLNGLWIEAAEAPGMLVYLLGVFLAFVVFGGLGTIIYLYIFNRRTRQSLHDLVVGSFVLRGLEQAVPTELATPRLHLIVATCWLVLALIVPGLGFEMMTTDGQTAEENPLADLQAAIQSELEAEQVRITIGTSSTAWVSAGTSTTTFLQVLALPGDNQNDPDDLVLSIASIVLDRHPDLFGRQVLAVKVRRGFDFGIAQWRLDHEAALDAAGWRNLLGQRSG